jgi:hypothetical protein
LEFIDNTNGYHSILRPIGNYLKDNMSKKGKKEEKRLLEAFQDAG